jgi:organic radical activating enzyme
MIPIDEIFGNTMQGEGVRMGVPSVFVRFGGCNLQCRGFGGKATSPLDGKTIIEGCDSIHAVNAKHFKHTWTYYDNFMDIVKDIQKHINVERLGNSEPVDIVFTGGETMLHAQSPIFNQVLEYFHSRGHYISIETNGTIDIDFDKYPAFKNVHFSMSVKMSSSGEPIHKRWKPEVVDNYIRNTEGSYFKFVLSKDSIEKDSTEVFEFLDQVP